MPAVSMPGQLQGKLTPLAPAPCLLLRPLTQNCPMHPATKAHPVLLVPSSQAPHCRHRAKAGGARATMRPALAQRKMVSFGRRQFNPDGAATAPFICQLHLCLSDGGQFYLSQQPPATSEYTEHRLHRPMLHSRQLIASIGQGIACFGGPCPLSQLRTPSFNSASRAL
eukprot:3597911-Amphidinium_carterae.1